MYYLKISYIFAQHNFNGMELYEILKEKKLNEILETVFLSVNMVGPMPIPTRFNSFLDISSNYEFVYARLLIMGLKLCPKEHILKDCFYYYDSQVCVGNRNDVNFYIKYV